MFDFHEKRKIRSWLYSKVTVGLLFALAVFIAFQAYERFVVERAMALRTAEREAERAALEARATLLAEKVETLSAERGQEAEIRERFNVAREGEKVVILLRDEAPGTTAPPASPPPPPVPAPWYAVFKFW
jgi:hypothetical protein